MTSLSTTERVARNPLVSWLVTVTFGITGIAGTRGWSTGNFALARYSASGTLLAKTGLTFTTPK